MTVSRTVIEVTGVEPVAKVTALRSGGRVVYFRFPRKDGVLVELALPAEALVTLRQLARRANDMLETGEIGNVAVKRPEGFKVVEGPKDPERRRMLMEPDLGQPPDEEPERPGERTMRRIRKPDLGPLFPPNALGRGDEEDYRRTEERRKQAEIDSLRDRIFGLEANMQELLKAVKAPAKKATKKGGKK